jgi:PD-(D/E)XK nuclease superfamily protein
MDMDLEHGDITEKIIGAAFEVHSILGYGFLEKVYQRAMQVELEAQGLKAEIEQPINVIYDVVNLERREIVACTAHSKRRFWPLPDRSSPRGLIRVSSVFHPWLDIVFHPWLNIYFAEPQSVGRQEVSLGGACGDWR